ncbi:putative chitinase 10 [Babylonia areolata]|uniref:putative chitinase 10 n=1 Tax=Babylonia areolata TaxID=304850 RepID=UPI003FD6464C
MRVGLEVNKRVRHPPETLADFGTRPQKLKPLPSIFQFDSQPDMSFYDVHPYEFQCPRPFGLYRDTRDCRRFYQCVWHVSFHHICGKGTVWNDDMKICDWPTAFSCLT